MMDLLCACVCTAICRCFSLCILSARSWCLCYTGDALKKCLECLFLVLAIEEDICSIIRERLLLEEKMYTETKTNENKGVIVVYSFFVFGGGREGVYLMVHGGKYVRVALYLDKAQQPQEQRYPFHQCVQYFRVSKQFNVRTDVDA